MSSKNVATIASDGGYAGRQPMQSPGEGKVIRANNLREYPWLTGCTLSQASDGGSTLELEIAGAPPDWAQYWRQVTLLDMAGKALFTGQITNVATTNSGGAVTTMLTVQDYWYLLERQTSATQIANIKAQGSARTLKQSLSKQVESWANVAAGASLVAPGWTCDANGGTASGNVRLNVSKARYSVTPSVARERFYSMREVFLLMGECNPDCLLLSEPTGVINVVSISNCETLTLRADRMLEAAEIYPSEASRITGVCVAIAIQREKSTGVSYEAYPANASISDAGVRFFSATLNAENTTVTTDMVTKARQHLLKQATAWYEAVKGLIYMGSITLPLDEVLAQGIRPLGMLINISGGLKDWESMNTPCTAVTWDFAGRRVTLTLGKDIEEPSLHELELPYIEPTTLPEESSQGPSPGPGHTDSSESSESSESQAAATVEKCECAVNWGLAQLKINEIISVVNQHALYLTHPEYNQIQPVHFVDQEEPGPGTSCIFYVPPSIQ